MSEAGSAGVKDENDGNGVWFSNVQVGDVKLVLTDADRAQINARARKELLQIIAAQALMGAVVALLAWIVAGNSAALSALAGAGAYFVPNSLFALRLFVSTYQPKGSNPFVFLVGEMLKMGAAVVLLWLIAQVGGDQVQWLAVLAGLVAVLKGYMLMLAFWGSRSHRVA